MNLIDAIKSKIKKIQKSERLDNNPNDKRLTFISNEDAIKLSEVREYRCWYIGSGNELLNFYTNQMVDGFMDNIIYNRNNRNMFWSQSASECGIKRIHSGIPNVIVTTLSNVIGYPDIKEATDKWKKIEQKNDFKRKLTQQGRNLTLAEGWGAYKLNIDKSVCDVPLIEYYEAENVEYIIQSGMLVGMIFRSYYQEANKKYVLLETRYTKDGNSYVDYDLYELKESNEIEPVNNSEILSYLPRETQVIRGLNRILAVPSRYFYDPMNQKYGKSIFAGKVDAFDFLDEIWSQASQTNRVSTPVEYYNPDVLNRSVNDPFGHFVGTPSLYNRQYVQKTGVPDGDGMNSTKDIETTQPDLNFDKYASLAIDVLQNIILTGLMSPATFGIDVARKDNATAQREKEKVTIFTRNSIIDAETQMINDIITLSLYLLDYMETGKIDLVDYDISVKYNEFANPSFEEQLQTLGSAFSNMQISTEQYVNLLWGDKLSDEEKAREIEYLNENNKQDGMFDEGPISENVPGAPEEEGTPLEAQD